MIRREGAREGGARERSRERGRAEDAAKRCADTRENATVGVDRERAAVARRATRRARRPETLDLGTWKTTRDEMSAATARPST